MTTLTVPATTDFSADLLINIDLIDFTNPVRDATATFAAGQFDNLSIIDSVLIDGTSLLSRCNIVVRGGSVDASQWQFADWSLDDTVKLQGTSGIDTITGSSQADIIRGRGGADTIDGGAGADIITGGLGADTLKGGRQRDEFHYATAADIEAGESIDGGIGGNDAIILNGQDIHFDFMTATISGVERVKFTNGGWIFVTGDQVGGTSALLTIEGSNGFDWLLVQNTTSVDLSNVSFINWTAFGDSINISGTSGADTLIGTNYGESIFGVGGSDTIDAGGGDDNVSAFGMLTVDCGSGDDRFSTQSVDAGSAIEGGTGFDQVSIGKNGGPAAVPVVVDFRSSALTGFEQLTLSGPESSAGTLAVHFTDSQIGYGTIEEVGIFTDDVTLTIEGQIIDLTFVEFSTNSQGLNATIELTGTAGTDVLFGGSLDDTIIGGGGMDALAGGDGDDTLVYNSIDDVQPDEYADGGGGLDTIELHGGFNDVYDLSSAALSSIEVLSIMDQALHVTLDASQTGMLTEIQGHSRSHFIRIVGADALDLSAISFPVWDPVFNLLIVYGTANADSIVASSQADNIWAGDGDDVINGGDGDDRIHGAYGRDEMTGGDGSDVFVYHYLDETPTGASRDRIADFTQGEDVIVIDVPGFTFIEDSEFSGLGTAEINYEILGATTILNLDGDGDGSAESKIALTGAMTITSADLVLL